MNTRGRDAQPGARKRLSDNPYRASATLSTGPRKPPEPAILLLTATAVLLGITQLAASLWAWHAGALSRPPNLLIMLFNAGLYFVLAYGSYRHSRICACLLLIFAELHAMLVVWLLSPLPAYTLLGPLVLLLILVTGTQMVFRSHRRS